MGGQGGGGRGTYRQGYLFIHVVQCRWNKTPIGKQIDAGRDSDEGRDANAGSGHDVGRGPDTERGHDAGRDAYAGRGHDAGRDSDGGARDPDANELPAISLVRDTLPTKSN